MGEVHLATLEREAGFRKVVAVKRSLPHLATDPRVVSRFEREARLAAVLTHRHIVQVFDFGRADGVAWLAMEYVHGVDLKAAQDRLGPRPMPAGLAVEIGLACARGLHHAHGATDANGQPLRLVHRDVSPHNVLLSFDGDVKITDFGLADEATGPDGPDGMIQGKYAYMSPEQARGGGVDARSDQYSLAVVLYELLTGARAFHSDEGPMATVERVLSGRALRPLTVFDVPPPVVEVVERAMSLSSAARYPDMLVFAEALRSAALTAGIPIGEPPLAEWLAGLFAERVGSVAVPAPMVVHEGTAAADAPISGSPSPGRTVGFEVTLDALAPAVLESGPGATASSAAPGGSPAMPGASVGRTPSASVRRTPGASVGRTPGASVEGTPGGAIAAGPARLSTATRRFGMIAGLAATAGLAVFGFARLGKNESASRSAGEGATASRGTVDSSPSVLPSSASVSAFPASVLPSSASVLPPSVSVMPSSASVPPSLASTDARAVASSPRPGRVFGANGGPVSARGGGSTPAGTAVAGAVPVGARLDAPAPGASRSPVGARLDAPSPGASGLPVGARLDAPSPGASGSPVALLEGPALAAALPVAPGPGVGARPLGSSPGAGPQVRLVAEGASVRDADGTTLSSWRSLGTGPLFARIVGGAGPPVRLRMVATGRNVRANLSAQPYGEVELDGVSLGGTPLADLPLRAGLRRLVVRGPDGSLTRLTVEVGAGGEPEGAGPP